MAGSTTKVVNHLKKSKAKGSLVMPKWPVAKFWPFIFDRYSMHSFVKEVFKFTEGRNWLKNGDQPNSIFTRENFRGSLLAIRLDCTAC